MSIDNNDHQSPFQDVAEKKVKESFKENKALLKRAYDLRFQISEAISQNKDSKSKMTAREMARSIKALIGNFFGETEKLKPHEDYLFRLLDNYIGLKVLMIVDDERLLKATLVELKKVRALELENESKETK